MRGGRGVEGRAELDREPATLVVEVSRAVEILAEEGDVAQVRQHRHPARVVVQTAGNLEACLERLLGRLDVAVLRGEDAEAVQRLGPRDERRVGRGRKGGLETCAALAQVGVQLPELPQCAGEP